MYPPEMCHLRVLGYLLIEGVLSTLNEIEIVIFFLNEGVHKN